MECSASSPLMERKREETEEAVQLHTAEGGNADVQLPSDTLRACNASLRRNFDHLKGLYLKLSQVNQHLRDTCQRLQAEKLKSFHFRELMEAEDSSAMLLEEGHDYLAKEMEAICFERDQARKDKESIELECIKLLSLKEEEHKQRVGDLAHKCKYLEMDLETACVAAESAHDQLLKVTYEKDTIIAELNNIRQQLEENVQRLEEDRESDHKNWANERHELVKAVDEIERERANYKETCRSLENQVTDLHAMLAGMEQAAQDAELRHAESIEVMQKDKKCLEEDLVSAKKEWKSAKESIIQLQKEIVELRAESGGFRAQLQDALNDAHQYQQNALSYMHANEQLQEGLAAAHENITAVIQLRENDEKVYQQHLRDYQANWEMERDRIIYEKNSHIEDRIAKILKQNQILKKRLKQSYNVLAIQMADYSTLKSHALEARAQPHLHTQDHGRAVKNTDPIQQASREQIYSAKHQPLDLDLDIKQIARRQMKLLDLLAST